MSTQQIPTTAQLAAARSALWHQNTTDPTVLPQESSSPEESTRVLEGEPEVSSEPATEQASEPRSSEQPRNADATIEEPATPAQEHTGIDLSDPQDAESASESEAATSSPVPAIITQAAAREFLNRAGLLLFSSRSQLAGVPAPTFVEATLGTANANPSLPATEIARTLLAHLVADGSAVALNLLGLPTTTGEAPDFIVSSAAFPYIFTLRGDKAWKQPPVTSGPTKVSPLAANTYTLLIEGGPQSAYALAGTLGKEVTEAAVLRALSELWQQIRIIPVPQPRGKPTLWEPISSRFTKQIKTGANAGQPTALSTLISLFLGQAILATEDEIETFLSPLAPRSRVRDVLHALSGARQLETITIEGKHHLHIAGDLPLFASEQADQQPADSPVFAEDGSRIRKFVAKPRKLGTGFADRPKPFRSPSERSGRPDTRPARQPAGKRFAPETPRPSFNKPWEEERQERVARQSEPAEPAFQDIDLDALSAPAEKPRQTPSAGKPAFGRKPGFGGKPAFGDRPRFGGDRPAFNRDRSSAARPGSGRERPGGDRPAFNRDRPDFDRRPRDGGSEGAAPRRDFASRDGDSRPPRKPFGSKPAFGARSSAARPPFAPDRSAGDRERRPFRRDDASGDSRPPRRTFDSGPRSGASTGRPPFSGGSRPAREGAVGSRPPFRKFDAPRSPRPSGDSFESRPPRRSFDSPKPFGKKPFVPRDAGEASSGGNFAPRRPGFGARPGGGAPRRDSGPAGARDGGGYAGKKPFSPRAGAGDRPAFKKPFSRSSPDAPGAGTFDKFKGGNKPWGKRPPARKYKPKGDQA